MRKFLPLFVLTIIVFGILTISTAKIETPFDGNDTYGFPLTFFIRFSGMCSPCPPNPTETFYLKLVVDITVAFLFAVISLIAYAKLRQTMIKKKSGT